MSVKRIKYLEDKINKAQSLKRLSATGSTITTKATLDNQLWLDQQELKKIAQGKGYTLYVPKGKGSISYEDNTGLGGKINSIQKVDKTPSERVAAAAKSVSGVKDSKKKAPTDDGITYSSAADRKKESQRVQALAKKREEEEKAARKEREAAAKAKIPHGRALIKSGMFGDADSREQRDKSKERRRKKKEAEEWSEKLRLKRENNLSGITNAQLKEYTLDDVHEKINRLRERQASYDKSRLKEKKKIEEGKRAEVIRERRETQKRVQKKAAETLHARQSLATTQAENKELHPKRLYNAFYRLFGYLDSLFGMDRNHETLHKFIESIVDELIKIEKFPRKNKHEPIKMLAGQIFDYIKKNYSKKHGELDDFLNNIMQKKLIGSRKKQLVILENPDDKSRNLQEFWTYIRGSIMYSNIFKKYKLEGDDFAAVEHFGMVFKTLGDTMRKHIVDLKNSGKKYLNRPTAHTKPGIAKIRSTGDGRVLSQSPKQRKNGFFQDSKGRRHEGNLRGKQVNASSFDPNSLTASHPKPIDSKFFMDRRYDGNDILHYFLYNGMIRFYEHGFYIPGDDTLHGEQKKSDHHPDLEYTTNIRSGTIKKEGKGETWYSQTPDNQWVWKQSMKGEDKSRHSWKHIKKNFKYNYIHKKDDLEEVFEDFVKQQENNPRYIIFKGITTTLFGSSKTATNKKDPFKFGFIDTDRGIELGDYRMFECINNYHETSAKAFREGQQPQYQTPLMFFIHKEHLKPPTDAKKIGDWAKKRSILSEYEYRELFLNKLMEQQYTPLMEEIQSLTDFTTAGKYCEYPNSINKNHTELCYSTGEKDEEGKPIYKSNVIFPKDQFEKMTGEQGILAIQHSILENFITETGKKIRVQEETKCTEEEDGEPCFELILEAYDKIATFKTTTEERLKVEIDILTEYTVFLHQLLDLNLTDQNKKQVQEEIEKVKNFTETVTQMFMKLINGKKLDQILKNMFNKNNEKLIKFKEIQLQDFQWVNLEEENKRRDAIDGMEKEWKEQKTKFNDLMNKHFKEKWAEAASDLKEKIEGRDNEIANILLEYINAGKKAHDEDAARLKREAEEKAEQARLAKEEEDRKEAARLKKVAEEKQKEAARLKKVAEEKAKKEKEAARKKILLATLRKWQETYEKEKREEERRVLMEEIRKNYNNAIEHNIKIRKEINDKLEELGEEAKKILEKNDPDIYTKLIRLGSKWETQILSLKDKGLEDKISQCLKEFTDLLGNVNDLLTKYEDSHLSSYATNIKKIKDELEEKIGRCEDFIKEVKQHHTALLELNENFDDDGKVIVDASLMDIHDAILKIDTMINPNHHQGMTMEDVSQEGINEDPVPKLMKPIILELKSKLEEKENTMKDVVTENLKDINNKLIQNKNEMKNILKKYGYNNTPEEEEQNNPAIESVKQVIILFDELKNIMEEEKNIEKSIEDIYKQQSSDEVKTPEDGWTQQDIEEGNDQIKTNEEKLKESHGIEKQKEALEIQLDVQKQLLVVKGETLKKQLDTLRNLVDMDEFKKNLKEAVAKTDAIFEKVDEMKRAYDNEEGKDLDHGPEKTSIEQILKQFENIIIKGGASLMKKREDIKLIHDILEKHLDNDQGDGVKINDIKKIMDGTEEDDSLSVKLMMVPELLINITNFLLEDAIYNKALLDNNKYMAAAEKKNAELEQARLKKEDEIKNRIKKEEEDRIEAARLKREAEEKAEAERIEAERIRNLAIAKEKYEQNLAEKQHNFEEAQTNYTKLLSKYDEPRYSKETQDLNDELMEMIFKSGLLHSDQTYQEEDEPGHRQGVEDWFDRTGEGEKMKEDNISYEQKLKKYNEAMKKTNVIFG